MKTFEVQLIRVCDFCGVKTKCYRACAVCSRDICQSHLYEIIIPHAGKDLQRLVEDALEKWPKNRERFRRVWRMEEEARYLPGMRDPALDQVVRDREQEF